MPPELPHDLAALDLQPRASQPQSPLLSLPQAIAASPLIALATVGAPPFVRTEMPITRGNTLPNPAHAYIRVQARFHVDTALRGALTGEICVDAALWQRDLQAHRTRVLEQRDLPLSAPRVIDGDLAAPRPGAQVVLLLRKTPHGLEFIGQNAVLHLEMRPVVQALLAVQPT